jgi:uncharacterized protein
MNLKCLAFVSVISMLVIAEQALAEPLDDAKAAYAKKDYPTAFGLWRPLAEGGNAEAQRGLGILYENGLAVTRDENQAVDWYRKASAQGDAQAEYRLGMRFVMGNSVVPHDVSQGLLLMQKAGEHGYIHSFHAIADFYRTGGGYGRYGIREDTAIAISWYRRAADLGDAPSQGRLGLFYQYGQGVPKDVAQAISWYRKAADQGDFVSQNSLGRIYEYGDGKVEMSKETARCWYQKVAQSDNFLKGEAEKALDRLEKQLSTSSAPGGCE